MDYKTVFTNLCLDLQQNRSWIKGLGKNSIHSFPDGSAFCPGAPKRVPSDSEKHRRVYTSSNVCHSHEWRVDTASGLTLKKQNACLHAVRHAVAKIIACIHGLRSEGVKADQDEDEPGAWRRRSILSSVFRHSGVLQCTSHESSFFPRATSVWNSLPDTCFPPVYSLQTFKSNVNVHLRVE